MKPTLGVKGPYRRNTKVNVDQPVLLMLLGNDDRIKAEDLRRIDDVLGNPFCKRKVMKRFIYTNLIPKNWRKEGRLPPVFRHWSNSGDSLHYTRQLGELFDDLHYVENPQDNIREWRWHVKPEYLEKRHGPALDN